MNHYQCPHDLSLTQELISHAPKETAAFLSLKSACEQSDRVIPEKYRELISIAVALTTQCAYCIDVHTRKAAKVGASKEELAETVFMADALRAGGAVGHGLMAMRLFDTAQTALKK